MNIIKREQISDYGIIAYKANRVDVAVWDRLALKHPTR